jgi:hypothetical protein
MLSNKDLQNIGKLIALEIDPLSKRITALEERTEQLVTGVNGMRKTLDEQEYAVLKLNDTKQDQKLQELADHTGYSFKTP